jgi:hypothetical protein
VSGVDVEVVRRELEVYDPRRLARRPILRPALDVQADEQPADDPDDRPERADEELLEVHPVLDSLVDQHPTTGSSSETAARP